MHPDIQRKVYDETRNVLGKDVTKSVTMQDLNELNYLELVIKESLRLYPSVPFMGRMIPEETALGHVVFPEGTTVKVSPYLLGRNPKVYPDPLKFDPQRFNVETDNEKNNPYSFIPFSAGPRNCIGQRFAMLELKSIVSKVVRNFEITIKKENQELELSSQLILRPINGVILSVKRRN